MQIPLLDLKGQYLSIKEDVDGALRNVVDSQHFILSEEVTLLEKEVAAYCNMPYAAGVASGTDALVLILRAMDIGEGSAVITTPFTFFASAECASIVGAKPVFVDIESRTYNIDPEKLKDYLRKATKTAVKKIKAVIPVHIYGQCADMDAISEIAGKYGIKVVEDCAQAIGALYKGRKAASMSAASALSFFPSKNLGAFGDGGMVVSPDAKLVERVKRLRVHGSSKLYLHDEIGYNSRLDSLQAAVLRVKLRKLDQWLEARRKVAARYNDEFSKMGIVTPEPAEYNVHTYHQYTIRVDKRDELLKYLNDNGVSSRVYYPVPLHLQPCYKDLGYFKGDLPVSEEMSDKVLSLPVYPELSEEAVGYIINTVKRFVG